MAISELQLSLIALGVVGVAGVFAYNKWQERKYHRQAERAFRTDHVDVLLEPQAPSLPEAPVEGIHEGDRIEPVDLSTANVPAPQPTPPQPPQPPEEDLEPIAEPGVPLVHGIADAVVRFEAAEPVAAPQVWQAAGEALSGVAKPVRWLGWSASRKVWQQAHSHSAVASRHWRIALQLADRRGALTSDEIEVFVRGVQQLAERFTAILGLPDRRELALRAAELDQFCAGVDVQIGVHVVANDPAGFPGTKLRGIAEAAGMRLEDDGMYHARDDAGHEIYTMANLEPALFVAEAMASFTTHGVTLNLDVPCVMSGGAAFGAMVTAARQLAAGLNGTVVDDNRAPLAQKSLDVIRGKIVEFQDLMSQRGIPAGTATALRLFS